jgi:hypothetical protein
MCQSPESTELAYLKFWMNHVTSTVTMLWTENGVATLLLCLVLYKSCVSASIYIYSLIEKAEALENSGAST